MVELGGCQYALTGCGGWDGGWARFLVFDGGIASSGWIVFRHKSGTKAGGGVCGTCRRGDVTFCAVIPVVFLPLARTTSPLFIYIYEKSSYEKNYYVNSTSLHCLL